MHYHFIFSMCISELKWTIATTSVLFYFDFIFLLESI